MRFFNVHFFKEKMKKNIDEKKANFLLKAPVITIPKLLES